MWLTKLFFGILAAYAGVVALAYFMQTHLLFPTRLASSSQSVLPETATQIEVRAPANVRLAGLRISPEIEADSNKPILIGFGGNAWHAQTAAVFLHGLFPENEVIVFHYRGYGASTGRPSAADLQSDALLIYDHIHKTVAPKKMVGVGFSIGSGVAAHLSANRPLAGLILVSPFDSLQELASQHYPWLPVKWLLRHHMETVADIQGITTPIAVISAERDTIIPPRRTQVVRRVIQNLVLDRTIAGAGHNDVYGRVEFHEAIVAALEKIEIAMKHQ